MRSIYFLLTFYLLRFTPQHSFAQILDDSLGKFRIETSAYIDVYYNFDFAQPENNERDVLWYNHKRHNEFNVNHGIIKTAVHSDKVRANISLMIGTYSQYNLINEQELIRNIYEGNIGFKLSQQHRLWLDAGIFASHIGFESAISKDCWTPSRSILADNTPYYEAGAKITYNSKNKKWLFSTLILNGWQRIKRLPANSMPSLGTQIQHKPNSKILLNSSTYIGNEGTDSLKKMRYFHNFYTQIQLNEKWSLLAGFDIGWQNDELTQKTNSWSASALMLRCKINPKLMICGRGEHYFDKHSIIVAKNNGLRTYGYSVNLDYSPVENMVARIEARGLSSLDKNLIMNKNPAYQNYFLMTSMEISF
jgi:hypothetical protein